MYLICIDGIDFYYCNCILGYIGKLCEKEINECDFFLCVDGLICIDEVGFIVIWNIFFLILII